MEARVKISANRLRDGAVVWLNEQHELVDEIQAACAFNLNQVDSANDLRAAGPLLRDQLSALRRWGFTGLLTPPSVLIQRWHDAAYSITLSKSEVTNVSGSLISTKSGLPMPRLSSSSTNPYQAQIQGLLLHHCRGPRHQGDYSHSQAQGSIAM